MPTGSNQIPIMDTSVFQIRNSFSFTLYSQTKNFGYLHTNEQHWSAEPSVREALLLVLQTLSLSFLTNSSSDSKAFLHFIAILNSSTPCLPFLRCEDMATVTNWPLHMHYGITLWAYLSQTHRPVAYITVLNTLDIPFWTSRKRQSQTSPSSMEKPQILRAPSYVITHLPLHTCYTVLDKTALMHIPSYSHWYLSLDA